MTLLFCFVKFVLSNWVLATCKDDAALARGPIDEAILCREAPLARIPDILEGIKSMDP